MSDDEALLRRALAALGPYRSELVIVGAWAHRLFERHPLLACPLGHSPLMTEDADLASPAKLAIIGDPIPQRLADAGFDQRLTGTGPLPVMKFFARESNGFYIELIAPLIGGDSDRDGEPRTLVTVGGATAQLLRHVELLRFETWELELGDGVVARIANPASYLVQKILTRREGAGRDKYGKDLLYIHDTLLMFGPRLHEFRPLATRVLAQLPPKLAAKVRSFVFTSYPERLARAAEIALATGRPYPPDATAIANTCRVGFGTLFGS
ncbi:MAG: hypothetical protein H0T76_24090 [Nannocystis sp.]|nr:GSU2403 family nucleotidyltransferase fold protein [Nannocystis sp.]MBA3549569.1 hypothetical protein [Nannocystis sp.]